MNEILLHVAAHVTGDDPVSQGVAGGTIHAAQITQSLVPSHKLGTWLLEMVRKGLDVVGQHHNSTVEEVCYTVIVLVVAWAIARLLHWGASLVIRRLVAAKHRFRWSPQLMQRTMQRCSYFLIPLFFMALVPMAFTSHHVVLHWIIRIAVVWLIVTLGIALNAVLYCIWEHYNKYENVDHHPLQGILNVCRGLVWIIVVIICVSVCIDRSPMALLAGLGAFAAALMLIFKDSILGFVAGIQLSTNDMVREGDWIIVPNTPANGSVVSMSLTAVKVQNWDNTIITLPPYMLVSQSFQNWRNVYTMGQRMISRNLYFDNNTIRPSSKELFDSLSSRYPCMKTYIAERQAAKAKGEPNQYLNIGSANGTIDTNLGLFRYYTNWYLLQHPQVAHDTWVLVTLNQSESYGASLNVYFYSLQTAWLPYEAVLSEVFEHLHAEAPHFGLTIYNMPDANTFTLSPQSSQP